MEREPPTLKTMFVVLAVSVVMLIFVVVSAVQGTRAARISESNQEILDAIHEVIVEIRIQAAISACVLLIEPADRTPENVAACHPEE